VYCWLYLKEYIKDARSHERQTEFLSFWNITVFSRILIVSNLQDERDFLGAIFCQVYIKTALMYLAINVN
jgi:hypothetical protein